MIDIVVLFMRVTNRTWPQYDIVDVFPIEKDPGPGVAIHPKHALMIVRDVPRDIGSYATVHDLLVQENLLDDGFWSLANKQGRRRWKFAVDNLTTREKDAIRNDGRLEINWADLIPVCIRKEQGIFPERPILENDLGSR